MVAKLKEKFMTAEEALEAFQNDYRFRFFL